MILKHNIIQLLERAREKASAGFRPLRVSLEETL